MLYANWGTLMQSDQYSSVLERPLKNDKTKVLMENGSLMKDERIAECSVILLTCIKQQSVLKNNFWCSFWVAS